MSYRLNVKMILRGKKSRPGESNFEGLTVGRVCDVTDVDKVRVNTLSESLLMW